MNTDFLTARSGFGLGIASVLNIGGSFFLYNYSPTPQDADMAAIRSDWVIVGQDIFSAAKQQIPQQFELPLS